MPVNNFINDKDREIRSIIYHLKKNGHSKTYIKGFIERNYFISDYYNVLKRVDAEPVDIANSSIQFKKVMCDEYFHL